LILIPQSTQIFAPGARVLSQLGQTGAGSAGPLGAEIPMVGNPRGGRPIGMSGTAATAARAG